MQGAVSPTLLGRQVEFEGLRAIATCETQYALRLVTRLFLVTSTNSIIQTLLSPLPSPLACIESHGEFLIRPRIPSSRSVSSGVNNLNDPSLLASDWSP